jgi:hypothetical protein
MSDQSKAANKFAFPAWTFPNFGEAMQIQIKTLLEQQSEVFDQGQKTIAAWTHRRQEAIESGFRTFQAICGCKDAAALTGVCGEWLNENMKRIFADISDAREQTLRLAEIGQKSATALFRQGSDLAASTSPSSAVAVRDVQQAKTTAETEITHQPRERTAAK